MNQVFLMQTTDAELLDSNGFHTSITFCVKYSIPITCNFLFVIFFSSLKYIICCLKNNFWVITRGSSGHVTDGVQYAVGFFSTKHWRNSLNQKYIEVRHALLFLYSIKSVIYCFGSNSDIYFSQFSPVFTSL